MEKKAIPGLDMPMGQQIKFDPGLYNVVTDIKEKDKGTGGTIVKEAIVAQAALFLDGSVAVHNLYPFQSTTVWPHIQQFLDAHRGVPKFKIVDMGGKKVFPPDSDLVVPKGVGGIVTPG